MDELTKICNELEKCNKRSCERNRIVCVKNKLREYIGEDENKYLQLKAQIKLKNENDRIGIYNLLPVPVSIFSLLLMLIYNISDKQNLTLYGLYGLSVLIIICIILIIEHFYSKKYEYKKIWRCYIEVVLENWHKEDE